jgi:putative ABC transport system permease protein
LLLIRGEARRKEMAIREALGSTRWRLVRQLFSESLILSLAGVATGLLLAFWCQRALLAVAPSSLGIRSSGLDLSVLGSALVATIMAALLSGLFPALRLSRGDLRQAVADTSRSSSAGSGRHRVLNGLVVGQIAVSMALLFAAGLVIVSFQKLMRVDPGFAMHNAICFRVGTFSKSVTAERLIQELSHLPGVQSVGAANIDLMNDVFSNGIRITADNAAAPGGSISGTVDVWHATTNYFSAAGIPLRAGRVFEAKDRYDVVIVNEALARQFFPNQDALGQIIRVPWTNSPGAPKRIVGVVASVKQHGLRAPEVPIYYMHYQAEHMGNLTVTARSTGNTTALLPTIRDAIRKMDPELVMSHVSTTSEIIARSLSSHRFATLLMIGFAVLAILLAAVGLYGVMSYTVSQRTREIGVRLALGAQRGHVFQLIVGRGMRLVGLGMVVGLVGALITARGIRHLLFDVSPTDPTTIAAIAALLGAVTFLACYIPARRAAKVDPMEAIRHE